MSQIYDHCLELRRQVQLCHEESIMTLKTTLGMPVDMEFESEETTKSLDSNLSKIDAFEASCQLDVFNLSLLTYWNDGRRLLFKVTFFPSQIDISGFDSFRESVYATSEISESGLKMLAYPAAAINYIRYPTIEMCLDLIREDPTP